jgi:hypothetical protein
VPGEEAELADGLARCVVQSVVRAHTSRSSGDHQAGALLYLAARSGKLVTSINGFASTSSLQQLTCTTSVQMLTCLRERLML